MDGKPRAGGGTGRGGGGTKTIRSGGTQVIVAKKTKTETNNKQKEKEQQPKEKSVNHFPRGRGVKIGQEDSEQEEDMWKCLICGAGNLPANCKCMRCEQPKGMTKEQLRQMMQVNGPNS